MGEFIEMHFVEHHWQEENRSIPGQVGSGYYLSQADAASVARWSYGCCRRSVPAREKRHHLKPMAWGYEHSPGRMGSRIWGLALTHFESFPKLIFASVRRLAWWVHTLIQRFSSWPVVEKWMCSGTLSRFLASSRKVCVCSSPFSCDGCSPFG